MANDKRSQTIPQQKRASHMRCSSKPVHISDNNILKFYLMVNKRKKVKLDIQMKKNGKTIII